MTPEQRIAQLEAELAREREEKTRLLAIVESLTAPKVRSRGAERQAAYRGRQKAESVTGDVTVPRHSDVITPPPPLDGSPPLPAPISPSPLSSPPSLFPVASQGESSEAAAPVKRQPTRSNALGEFIDWAKAETRKHLAPDAPDNCRLEKHQAARLGEAVKDHGLAAVKAAFGLWMGWDGARAAGYPLGMFAAKWEGWVGRVKAPGAQPAVGESKPTKFKVL